MSLLRNFGGFYLLQDNETILLTGTGEPERNNPQYNNAVKLDPQENPEAFNYGAIVDYTNGATFYLSNYYVGNPYKYSGDYIDNAGTISSAVYDDADFIWIVENFEVIINGFPEGAANDGVKLAMLSYLDGKAFSKPPSEEGFSQAGEMIDTLKLFIQLQEDSNFMTFFGGEADITAEEIAALPESVQETIGISSALRLINIKKNIVGSTGTYQSIVPVLETPVFGIDPFKQLISAYLNNIVNPVLFLDSAGGVADIESGAYFPSDYNVGVNTVVGDNGQITITDPDFNIDDMLTDRVVGGDGGAEGFFPIQDLTTSGTTVNIKWSYIDDSDPDSSPKTVIPHWVPAVGIQGETYQTSTVLSQQQALLRDKLIGIGGQDYVSWETLRELIKPEAPLTFANDSDIVTNIGAIPVGISTDDVIFEKYIDAISNAEEFDQSTATPVSFSSFFRQQAYEAAEALLFFYTLQVGNRFKALLLKSLIDSIQDQDLTLDDALQNALDQRQQDAQDIVDASDQIEDEGLDAGLIKKSANQCALLANLQDLAFVYKQRKNEDFDVAGTIHHQGYYQNRFYSVSSNVPSQTINKIQAPLRNEVEPFLMSSAALQSLLVPKIKLQKVFVNKAGVLETVDIPFDRYTREPDTIKEPIDHGIRSRTPGISFKGGASGIKSFKFDFDGETPVTAEKYVSAELVLFFQDFNSFVEPVLTETSAIEGQQTKITTTQFRYVDLVVNPLNIKRPPAVDGSSKLEHYDPSYYRIKAEVGWNVGNSEQVQKIIADSGYDYTSFKNAVEKANKTFMLCALEHDININNDGSVQITINYRGYADTLLNSTRFNALLPLDEQNELNIEIQKYQDVVNSGKCTQRQKSEYQATISSLIKEVAKRAYQRINNRMSQLGMIHTARYKNANDAKFFLNNGNFRQVPGIESTISGDDLSQTEPNDFTFFYLGDLVYVILDSMFYENAPALGAERMKLILCDFEYKPYLPDSSGALPNVSHYTCPLSCLPITVNNFSNWMANDVIGTERYNIPVMDFILTFINDVCGCFISEVCFTREEDKSLFFRQSNIIAPLTQDEQIQLVINSSDSTSDLGGETNIDDNEDFVGTTDYFPLQAPNGLLADEIIDYTCIYMDTPPKLAIGTGAYNYNLDNRILHFYIGGNRGLLKTASWSKQNVQYLRESRMFRSQGIGDYAQLATYYNVSINMFGNFLLFPGMRFYLDPFSIGGLSFGRPNEPGLESGVGNDINFSRLMGIGGYHLVTGVKVNITPEKFETVVEARFEYSGDYQATDGQYVDTQRDAVEISDVDIGDPDTVITNLSDCVTAIIAAQRLQ